MIVVTVARKPLAGTVADTVLEHGTGAIHVDACRVQAAAGDAFGGGVVRSDSTGLTMGAFPKSYEKGSGWVPGSSIGRWPANLVLQHLEGCVQEGTREVSGHKGYPNGPGGASDPMHGWGSDRSATVRPNAWKPPFTGPDGTETVAVWNCAPGCPVADIDEQSGVQKSGTAVRHKGVASNCLYGGNLGRLSEGTPDLGYGDAGGASRFFKQVGGADDPR